MKWLKGSSHLLALGLALGLALSQIVQAQLVDETQAGGATTATTSNSPGSEGVTNAIDNAPTKYQNRDIYNTGLTVAPSIGLSIESANDTPDRDPVTYELSGSFDGETFPEISSASVEGKKLWQNWCRGEL